MTYYITLLSMGCFVRKNCVIKPPLFVLSECNYTRHSHGV